MSLVYRQLLRVSNWCVLVCFFVFFTQLSLADEVTPQGKNVYQMVTGEDFSEEDRVRWNALYNTTMYLYGKEPAEFLKRVVNQLPVGHALDIATGEGRNAVYLAKKGFRVDGVDISEVALRKARRLAKENQVTIHTINQDLKDFLIPSNKYDVIVNFIFLQRSLIPRIKKGLKKGGMVVFQNFTLEQRENPDGKSLPESFLVKKNELKKAFEKDFEILIYEETNNGKQAFASLLARKK